VDAWVFSSRHVFPLFVEAAGVRGDTRHEGVRGW
jgi:hypothetical protein